MLYCCSDLHGKPLDHLLTLLDQAGFTAEDTLFILGDCIDRGPHGIEILRWAMRQENVECILGNHEAMLLSCSFLFDTITEDTIDALSSENLACLAQWQRNGNEPTLAALRSLSHEDPDALTDLLDYLRDLPLYIPVAVGDRDFLLCHTAPVPFDPGKKFRDYPLHDWIWCRPDFDAQFLPDVTFVFGHTHTSHYGEVYRGRILHRPGWIDIDTGSTLSLLRLDDGMEFYYLP